MKNLNVKAIIRNGIIILVVAVLGYAGYAVFLKKDSSGPALQTTAGQPAATASSSGFAASTAAVGQDFLQLLLSVQSIHLDDAIFSNKAFGLLQDFNRPIPPDQDPGRQDPFAPIGRDGTAISTQVSTASPSSITSTASTLNGSLLASDPTATRWFEYGTTDKFGIMTTPKSQTVPGAFAEQVTGLLPNTTYYVRAGALIGGITVTGNTVTWKTAQAAAKR